MATTDEMVIKWSMDSSNFNDGLTKMNKSMSLLQSEFKATSSNLKNFGTSTEQLRNKQEYLTNAMQIQSNKVETLRKAYERQADATGENSSEAQRLAIQLNNQISYYNRLEGDLQSTNRELAEQTSIWNKVSGAMDTASSKITSLGGKLTGFGKGLTAGVSAPLVGILGLSTKAAADLEQTQRKTEVIFGEMTAEVQAWALENERVFGLGSGTIEGYVGSVADIIQGMGMAKESSLDMGKGVVELGSQLANWAGVDAGESMNDIQRALTGAHDSVEKYGIKLTETVLNQYTMSAGLGDTFNKLGEAEKAQVRYAAILGSSQNAVDFWNEGNRSAAFTLNETKEQIGNISENIGKVLLPTVSDIGTKIADFTAKLAAFSSENPKLMETIVKISGVAIVLGPMFIILGQITKGIGTTISGINKLGQGFVKLKSSTIVTTAATKLMSIAQGALNFVMSLNPITLVIVGLVALGVAFAVLYNKCEWFRNGVHKVWESITGAFSTFNNFLKGVFSTDWTERFGAFGEILNSFFANCSNIWDSIKRIFSGIIDFVKGVFTGDWEQAWQGVKDIFGGIMDGLGAVIKAPLNAVIGLINMAITQLNKISFTAPDWVPLIGGSHFGVNLPKINYLYEGGIIDRPTMLNSNTVVGDSYKGIGMQKEAVIPLDSMYRNMRNIVREEGTQQPIYIMVDVNNNIDSNELSKSISTKVEKVISKNTKMRSKARGGKVIVV